MAKKETATLRKGLRPKLINKPSGVMKADNLTVGMTEKGDSESPVRGGRESARLLCRGRRPLNQRRPLN
jgi:hypothetical protein